MIDKSFQLLRTNPALTTNIKLVVGSDYKLYLESFDTNKQLSDQKYKHFSINKNNLYEERIVKFFKGLPSQLAFDVKYDLDNNEVFKTYDKQFDDIYWSGARSVEDDWYNEDFEYLAPLYMRKGNIPEGFVILRVDEPTPYEETDNEFNVTKLTKDNFYTQIVDRWKCVDFRDMRYQSDFGYFLMKNFTENTRFPEHSFELNFKKYEYSRWYGIDYMNGVYVAKSKFLQDVLYYEQPHFKLEKELTNFFRDNNLIYPNILNIKFLFNDTPANPNTFKNYSLNRYYGFYIDKLEFISNLTSYVTPDLKSGLNLVNNIFCSGTTIDGKPNQIIESPFVEGFKPNKSYWIHYDDDFYEVIKVYENDKYLYKVLSNIDLSGISFSQINNRSCFINYEEGYNYRCRTIQNPSGYTNFLSGFTTDFKIDPYFEDGTENTMFADLYLIQIDGKFHVLKKRGKDYFVQSDYAINSYPNNLEYWKGGKNSEFYVSKPIYEYKVKPLVYPVYRLKFSDIKDFDFDRVNTHFSDFDFEKDTYHSTAEHKLYATDYLDKSVIDKSFMVHPRGEDGQYEVMNVSSEYVADDELYEIVFNDLNDIWRKNQSIVKWGFAGSNCNCDYPYKLNNSIDIGDYFNRTVNIQTNIPVETEKNLDYFYRIGNFISGSTNNIVRYLNQTTNIEVDLMKNYSKKFNLDLYLNSDVDYFDYFFKNKKYFSVYDVLYTSSTLRYSILDGADDYSPSSTLFKGIDFNVLSINSISRDSTGKMTNFITNSDKNYNGYKFSIILNDVYYNYNGTSFTGINENGLSGNTIIDKSTNAIHVFLNDKFKNILVVINVRIPIQQSYVNLNNVPVFGEKYGLYTSKTLTNKTLYSPATGISPVVTKPYDPDLITAANFIDVFDDQNTLSEFDSGVTYYYLSSNGQLGSTGPINIFNSACTMTTISGWSKVDPPFILTINDPELLGTKKHSYAKEALKGPKSNIYSKYKTFYDTNLQQNYNVTEPLARTMTIDISENDKNIINSSGRIPEYLNYIYRYNGRYEPIFKDIQLFNNTHLYYSGNTIKYWDSNYRFDTNLEYFGTIEELIFSKVNPTTTPLKLKNTEQDKSMYPMIDEFGYQYYSRFIFNSNWDKDFYIITNPDQNPNKHVFANLSSVSTVAAPVQTKLPD